MGCAGHFETVENAEDEVPAVELDATLVSMDELGSPELQLAD